MNEVQSNFWQEMYLKTDLNNLINCETCGREIAKTVEKCPHCGQDQRNYFARQKKLSSFIVLLLLIVIGNLLYHENSYAPGSLFNKISAVNEEQNPGKTELKSYYFNSVADMISDSNLAVGDCATTLGYYTPNDGGGGLFNITKSFKIENFGTVHNLANGLKAELIFDGRTFSLKQFGIRGDGVFRSIATVYPTLSASTVASYGSFSLSNSADSFMIRKLLMDTPKTSEVVLDGKLYLIDQTIVLENIKTLRGLKNVPNNFINRATSTGGNTADFYSGCILVMMKPDIDLFNVVSNYYWGKLLDFGAKGVYSQPAFPGEYSGNFLTITGKTSNFEIGGLYVFGFKNGISKTEEYIWTNIHDSVFDTFYGNGIDLVPCSPTDRSSGQTNENTIFNVKVFNAGTAYEGVRTMSYNRNYGNGIIVGGSGFKIDHVDITGNTCGIALPNSYYSGIVIQSTYSEDNQYADIYIDKINQGGVTIVDGYYTKGVKTAKMLVQQSSNGT